MPPHLDSIAPSSPIRVTVNERAVEAASGLCVGALRDREKPGADVTILNGAPVAEDHALADGDAVVLIRRGETPDAHEMEALLVARHGPGVHAALKRARVGVAGCGGLGSAVAGMLARLGVGELRLVDFDVVEPSNLNRQQFFVDQIGQPKIEALSENLRRMNPYVRLDVRRMRLTRANMAETFAECDAVAECFDDPVAKRDLTLVLREQNPETLLVTVSGVAGYGPSEEIRVRRAFGNVFTIGDGHSAAEPGCGLLAPRVSVAAGHQANVILRGLMGENAP